MGSASGDEEVAVMSSKRNVRRAPCRGIFSGAAFIACLLLGPGGAYAAGAPAGNTPAGNAPAASTPVANVPADYRIRPGDVLAVTVFGEPTLTQPQLKVLPGGTIVEPLAGAIRVGGMTTTEAANAVVRALTTYLRAPQVTVAVSQVASANVYVLGNVKTPGKYALGSGSKLMDALAAAGGVGPTNGNLPDARIAVGPDVKTVSLQKLLREGDLTDNVAVSNGMTVYVTSPLTFNVEVYGSVDHPGDVTLQEGDRLVAAIARAGNSVNSNADLNRITLQRIGPDGKAQTQTINLYEIYKGGDLTKDPVLQKGDTVYVPQGHGHKDTVSPVTSVLESFGLFRP
jgi:polysaccharide export outer membrane protein